MISIAEYQKILKLMHTIVLEQTDGLTDEDMLIQPQPGGNCMLWVLAHILENLREIAQYISADIPAGSDLLDSFGYGSDPIKGPSQGLPTRAELLTLYDQQEQAVLARLSEMTLEQFDEQVLMHGSSSRMGWATFFSVFHHAYHVGQLEPLRNLAGRTEKVI